MFRSRIPEPDALESFRVQRLSRQAVPRSIETLDSLSKTPGGKVDYSKSTRREGVSR